jgi:hypothetical protein
LFGLGNLLAQKRRVAAWKNGGEEALKEDLRKINPGGVGEQDAGSSEVAVTHKP